MTPSSCDLMDPLDFLSEEELSGFFHCKKTELSCLVEPRVFLSQLRDHDLVEESLYEKVIRMKSKERIQNGVYQMLDWLEKKKGDCIIKFWRCVFKDHIMHKYPELRVLRNSLMDGSYKYYEMLPDVEEPNESENGSLQKNKKQTKCKIKKGNNEDTEEEVAGPSSQSTPQKKKPINKPIFYSPVKGDKKDIWTWPLYKSYLPITCGDAKGTLYRNKLAKGELCILSDNQWFTPNEFEKFAEKGHCKNWKLSIRCERTPLLKLIKEGHLQVPRGKRRCVGKRRKVLFPVTSSESSSSSESSCSQSVHIIEDSSSEEEDRMRMAVARIQEDEDDEDEHEPVDLSMFDGPSLPVTSGASTGVLYKDRFTGKHRKSIRTDEHWYTAEEFVQKEVTLIDAHWKKDILCHGKTIHYLLTRKVLKLHSILCECEPCHPEEPDNDDWCFICISDKSLVCCDSCPRAFHPDCHVPALQEDTLSDSWTCTFCIQRTYQWISVTQDDALNTSMAENVMRCEYLLLCMYKEDVQHIFTDDPCTTVEGYSRIISRPMWLDQVKQNLQNGKYERVGEFVDDIRLIFENCQQFNRDNEFSRMGSRLNDVFDQQF